MKKVVLAVTGGIITLLAVSLSSQNAWAIPAFARKYQTSCLTCHAIFPHLTAVGEAFRMNGYKLPNDELYVKDKPVSMGAEAYKRMFPNAVWPTNIPGLPPIAILVNSSITNNFSGPDKKKLKFNLPSDASILAAGNMGRSLSFFTELAFDNADNSSEVNAWLMYQGLGSSFLGDNHLNLKVGTVGDQEIGLPNARDPQRFSNEDYLYHSALDLDSHPGVEVNGFGHKWRYAAGIVESDTTHNLKDYYATFSLKFGGVGYDGSGGGSASQGNTSISPSGYWRDDSVHLGGFVFRGYKDNSIDNSETYDRFGADVRVNHSDLSVVGGYAYGDDQSVTFTGGHPKQNIWFGEADYFFYPWMLGYCRYESLNTSNSDNSDANYSDRARIVSGLAFLIRANVKATIEGEFYTKDSFATAAGHSKDYYNNMSVDLNWAF